MKKLFLILALIPAITACDPPQSQKTQQPKKKAATTGTVTIENETSNTTSEITLKKGVKDGIAKQYYDNGKIWKEVTYKNGMLDGIAKVYDREGRLQRRVSYKKGKHHGKLIKYFKSGNPKVEAEYDEGLPLPGIIERDYRGNEIKQPEIMMTKQDKLLKENIYNVIFRLDQKARNIHFYAYDKPGFWKPGTDLRLYELPHYEGNRNEGILTFEVPPGYFMVQEIFVYATYESSTGEKAVTFTKVNIAAENTGI